MKLQASELPISKSQARRKTPKLIPLIALISFLLTVLTIYYHFYHKKLTLVSLIGYRDTINNSLPKPKTHHTWPPRSHVHGGDTSSLINPSPEKQIVVVNPSSPVPVLDEQAAVQNPDHSNGGGDGAGMIIRSEAATTTTSDNKKKCELFDGEWIPNPDGPHYTNETCSAIQDHQNCMRYGRPDTGYLKWRWKPDECELPLFDPYKFLGMVRGKSLLFVGDSVARNHMQSLICFLSKVAHPVDASKPEDENYIQHQYTDYNFNISIVSSPYLIRTQKTDPNDFTRPFHLFLDEFDLTWTARLHEFDYVVISAGHWFFRPTYFYLNHTLAGCLYCPESNITHLPSSFSYRWAFRTAFRAIAAAADFRGVAFLRTFAPSHFEGGPWDKSGDCVRRRPFRRNETALEDYSAEMYRIQLEELRTAQGGAGKGSGGKFRLFDATKTMQLRPDGHPSKYGRPAGANQTFPNDCVHWCLPGPIDAWNDFLQELLKRELEEYRES